jgi:adenylosuccinate lyase
MIERYSLPKMAEIWEDKNKFSKFLEIELLTCEALSKLGKIPKKSLLKIKKRARFNLGIIKRLEEKTQHDVVAFVNNVASNLGKEAKYLHMGLTSSDLLDTTLSLQCRQATGILLEDLDRLSKVLARKAKKYKDTICIGRTHGVHAEPITLGLKFCLWFSETSRNIKRLKEAREAISVGKISGAVGTYAHVSPYVEKYILRRLGLKPADISTQIIQRDIHAEVLTVLAIIGSSLEKFATEIRHLQKTEVLEIEEPFEKGQIGSSAMPHKKNPVICERICGLARVLRANALVSLENIALWHERDISHSSTERIILPDSTIMLDYMLNKFIYVIEELQVYPENMMANLIKTKGIFFSQRILLELMKKGISRPKAYELVQSCALKSWKEKISFKDILIKEKRISEYLTKQEIESYFSLDYYLRNVNKIFKKVGL